MFTKHLRNVETHFCYHSLFICFIRVCLKNLLASPQIQVRMILVLSVAYHLSRSQRLNDPVSSPTKSPPINFSRSFFLFMLKFWLWVKTNLLIPILKRLTQLDWAEINQWNHSKNFQFSTTQVKLFVWNQQAHITTSEIQATLKLMGLGQNVFVSKLTSTTLDCPAHILQWRSLNRRTTDPRECREQQAE